MAANLFKLSKFFSFVLRHKPESIGLTLDHQGWARIDELIEKGNAAGMQFDQNDLLQAVATNDKKRFSISADGKQIRAAQGHSVDVALGLLPQEPPPVLYHGTALQRVESIMRTGLKPQSRLQVHLSSDEATAHSVGKRHGKPTILTIDARRMHANGFEFYLSDNEVWLTDHVPPEFLSPSSGRVQE